jgi:carbamoyltransferase
VSVNILGIHIGHDSSVALVKDGRLVADVAEERFVRLKHYSGIPFYALEYCLQAGGLSMKEIDVVAVSSGHAVPQLNFLFDMEGGDREEKSVTAQAADVYRRFFGGMQTKPPLYVRRQPLYRKTEIVHVDHHLAHAASAYYTSNMPRGDRALVVTCDGAGDGNSLCLWRGEGGLLTPLRKFKTEGSLGWFYSNVTEGLGWIHGDGEGKTMGLAPYGDPTKCKGVLDKFHPKYAGGDLVEPYDFGRGYYWNESGSMEFHFDDAYELQRLAAQYGAEHVAAEAQRILEEQMMQVIFPWMEKEKSSSLCAAGGVFLNVKLNQRLWYSGKVKKHWTYPNCGDSGLAVGSALYAYFLLHPDAEVGANDHLYWGPEYSDAAIMTLLKERGLRWTQTDNIADAAAALLAEGKILGWFQGRMESGPRALGNRSILMSTARAENKDIINARVKFREGFRPFCPSMTIEAAPEYLVNFRAEPFMITSFDTTPDKKGRIPAVVHADGTARPQTVTKTVNPRYWSLIQRFGELTGDPVILNTSMNIKGEPMICHPREALRCFFDSGIDALVLGNCLLRKDA